jgi:hypothetical protein
LRRQRSAPEDVGRFTHAIRGPAAPQMWKE